MSETQAIEIAKATADRLNLPNGPTAFAKRLCRVWPFPRYWRVTIQAERPGVSVAMIVNEASGEAYPDRIVYGSRASRVRPL